MAAHSMQPSTACMLQCSKASLRTHSTQPVEIVNPFPWHGRSQGEGHELTSKARQTSILELDSARRALYRAFT